MSKHPLPPARHLSHGSKSGIHFFQFPKSNPDKLRWWNLIKRRDSCDGFKVTNSTVLCEKHFADNAIKRNPNSWRLNRGSEPSLNLPQSLTRKPTSRKEPLARTIDSSISDFPDSSFLNVSTSTICDNDDVAEKSLCAVV